MASRTLLALRDRCKQRANMENSSFVTDSEWNSYINYSITELRDTIASKVGDDYFATSQSISLSDASETYALPADFYKLLWAEILSNDGYYYKLSRFEISEMNSSAHVASFAVPQIKYRLRENNIWFNPLSALGGRTARIWYVPLLTELSSDSDTVNGFNGWDEFIILKSARKALVKEEQDVSEIDGELIGLYQRIEAMAENRDQAQPMRIQDSERASEWYNLWP
jgi:hypothetical protein